MLTLTATQIPARTDGNATDWSDGSTHWRCTLNRIDESGKSVARMTVQYSMGSAHTNPPTLASVLESLRMDASAPASFADFCADLGYDMDSRQAEKTWKACRSIAVRLRKLIGPYGVFLLRDGEAVQAGHPNMLVGWMHRTHCYSWSHALQHEGYSIESPTF